MNAKRTWSRSLLLIPHPSSLIPDPPSLILHPSSFILHPFAIAAFLAIALSGCGTFTSRPAAPLPPTTDTPGTPPPTATAPRPGGYYLDDGPGANPPADLDRIPDAVPRWEPLRPANARPYVAMGVSYRPMTALEPYKGQGLATWYGRRYHGKPTASGEPYDMYAMTAAHAVLPIPSYARVTNLKTGSSVVVRVNDRGPFVDGRIIDVSYTAAYKLGILAGATMVEVESIIPAGSGASIVARQAPAPVTQPENVAAAPPPVAEKAAVEKPPATTPAGKPAAMAPKPETVAATALPAMAAPEPKASTAPSPVAEPNPPATQPAVAMSEPKAPTPPPAVAPSVPVAVAAAPRTPITNDNGRVFLQLGAFANRENADGFLARLKSQVDWLALQVVSRDGLHRVQAGPYANQSDARQAAERVAQALGIKPMVQVR